MSKWHGGKGSKQRPTDHEKFNDNWDRIFKSNNQKDKQKEVTDLNWDGNAVDLDGGVPFKKKT